LQEIIYAGVKLQIWFDRHIDFEHDSVIDASLGNLPRLVTLESIDRQNSHSRLMTKNQVK
jgi:hypothetical protein